MDTPHKYRKGFRRDAEMLSEAYSGVYNEGQFWGRDDLVKKGKEEDIARGAVRLQSPSGTSRTTLPKDDPKIEELKKQGYTEIPIEDAEDTDVADQAEFAKIDPLENEKARRQGFNPRENEEGELSDDWMEQDYKGRQEERGGDHAKGVKMAIEALGMFKDELHIDGHSEDINVNELADAHDQLSRALHWILDETDVEYITGGRATQKAEADSQPEQFTPMEFPSDEY